MSFISASLLAEPPLISLFDESDHPSFSASSTPSSAKFDSKSLIPMLSTPTKDLMDFEEQSPADKLYAEIYQKNLQSFLSFSGSHLKKKVVENSLEKQGTAILSLIDEQISMNGVDKGNTTNGKGSVITSLIDKQVSIDGSDGESDISGKDTIDNNAGAILIKKFRPAVKPKDEPKQVLVRGLQRDELLTLSDKVAESISQKVNFNSISSSRASSENKRVQFVRADSVAETMTDVEDCAAGLSDVIPRDSDYLAGESSSSEEEIKTRKRVLSTTSTTATATRSHVASTHRRLVRINLPYETLHTMQEDPRFDGYCHAWVRRPDFCKFGVNCNFIHDYPMTLAKKFGMIAVYIGPDGKEVKEAEEFLKLEDIYVKPEWTKLDQGAKLGSPGCYNENCRDFIGKNCKYGDKCWYKHPKTVIENGKWVTKDVRQLAEGEFRVYNQLDEREKIEIGDGYWGDRRTSVSLQGSLKSQINPRVSSGMTSTSLPLPLEMADVMPEYNSHKGPKRVVGKAVVFESGNALDSGEINDVDVDSNVTEAPYYPGSASAARAVAANHAKSVLSNRSIKASSLRDQAQKDLLLDIRSSTQEGVTKFKPSPSVVPPPKSGRSTASTNYNYWGDSRNQAPKDLLLDIRATNRKTAVTSANPSSTVVVPSRPTKSSTSTGYNYWGDEDTTDDRADYWKNATPAPISKVSRRQHAAASEAMTYAQLFCDESYKPSRVARPFIMPPQPVANSRETGSSKILRAKQERQMNEKPKDILIDIFTSPEPAHVSQKSNTSSGRHESVFDDPKIITGGRHKTSDPDADWAKTLKIMLAQKCTPIDWSNIQREPKLNTLIEFEL